MKTLIDSLIVSHTLQYIYRGEDKLLGLARQLHMSLSALVKEIEAACGVRKGDGGVVKADAGGIDGQTTDAVGVAAF